MADSRINLLTSALTTANDDFFVVDGGTNGTRKLNAFSPTFGGDPTITGTLTVNGTSLASGLVINGNGLALNTAGSASIRFLEGPTTSKWWIYKLSGDPNLYFRDMVNGRMQMTLVPNATSGTAISYLFSNLVVDSTAASTTTATGALVVSGGVGVGADVNTGGGIKINRPSICPLDFVPSDEGGNYWRLGWESTTYNPAGARRFYLAYNGTPHLTVSASAGNATFGGTLTANGTTFSLSTASANGSFINMDGLAGNFKIITTKTGGVDRWYFGQDTAAESGGNAGSPFFIRALTDAGAVIDTPLTITRAAGGRITTPRPVTISDSTSSTATNIGALVVSGGVGVGGAINASGNATVGGTLTVSGSSSKLTVSNSTANSLLADFASAYAGGAASPYLVVGSYSDPSTSGARIVVDTDYSNNFQAAMRLQTRNASGTLQNALTLAITRNATFAADVAISGTTASTSTSSGALVVSGGVGVGGAINAGGPITTGSDGSLVAIYVPGDSALRAAAGKLYLDTRTTDGGDIVLRPRINAALTLAAATGNATFSSSIGVGGSSNASVGVYVINTALTGVDQYGVASEPIWTSAATAGHTIWARTKTAASAFTLTHGQAFFVEQPTLGAGSSITNIYGMRVRNQGTTGVTNAYGLYVESQSGASSVNYAIYTAGGRINFQGLPTSSAGLPAGTLWNDGGTLKVA